MSTLQEIEALERRAAELERHGRKLEDQGADHASKLALLDSQIHAMARALQTIRREQGDLSAFQRMLARAVDGGPTPPAPPLQRDETARSALRRAVGMLDDPAIPLADVVARAVALLELVPPSARAALLRTFAEDPARAG